MKFSCTQENLNRGLQMVTHIASKNVHLPILHNVLIDARDSGVDLVATNLEIGIRVHVRGKVEEGGSFTIPAQVFSNYISLLPQDRVDITQEEKSFLVHCGTQKSKILGETAGEFPLIPEVEKQSAVTIPINAFKEALKQVIFSVSHDDSRPELTGVLCKVVGNVLTLVSTDSYRLSERKMAVHNESAQEQVVIIPSQALAELVRILPDASEEDIRLYISNSQVLFQTPLFELTTRIIEGAFPDYIEIIPTEYRTRITGERTAIMQAIKSASLFSKSGIHDVHFQFSEDIGMITLTTVNNHVGENVTKVAATISGEANTSVLNYRYVIDALSHISTQNVTLSIVDSTTPAVIRPENDGSSGDSEYTHIIMPIKQ